MNGDTGPNETGSPDDPDADEGPGNPGEGKGPNRGGHAPQEQGETLGEDGFSLTGEEEEEESPAAPSDEEGPVVNEEPATPPANAPTAPPGQYAGTAQMSQTISSIQAASVPQGKSPGSLVEAIASVISAISGWLDNLTYSQSEEHQQSIQEFEQYHQRHDPGYQYRGNNLGTKSNNPRGDKASKAAAMKAGEIAAATRGGQALQAAGAAKKGALGSIMGYTGSKLESYGKQEQDGFLSEGYDPFGKSEDDEDRW